MGIRFGHTEALLLKKKRTLNGHFSGPAETDPYGPPKGGLGLKRCDHVQVRYLESALIEDRSWN